MTANGADRADDLIDRLRGEGRMRQMAGERLPGAPTPMHVWRGQDGLAIAGDSWGKPDGQLVVLQHGGGQTRHAWKNTGQQLALAGYHVVAFDARGHGDSGWAGRGKYGVDHMVEDLRCVVAAVGGTSPALVGASMGGGTSLVAIGEKRLSASCLVMVDMAPQFEPEGAREIHSFMDQRPDGFTSLEEVAEAIANYQPHRPRPRTLDGLAKNVRRTADGKYRWHWDPAWQRDGTPLAEYRRRLRGSADHIDVPTLLVRGGLSNVVSEKSARRFLEQCPQAEYVNIDDAAHMVAGDRNDCFALAVIDFLKRVVPAGRG